MADVPEPLAPFLVEARFELLDLLRASVRELVGRVAATASSSQQALRQERIPRPVHRRIERPVVAGTEVVQLPPLAPSACDTMNEPFMRRIGSSS